MLAASLSVIAGCGAFDYPRQRSLIPTRMQVERRNGTWELTVSVEATITGFADVEENSFHDVTLLVYSSEGERVCKEVVGDMIPSGRTIDVEVTTRCTSFPHVITFAADESPCDSNTVIRIARYEGKSEDVGHMWSFRDERRCGEGLPPSGTG